jgi:hypothetical protein
MFTYLKSSFVFALHLFVTLLAWVAPFLLSWKICLAAYTTVMLQFTLFGRCLMNEHHGLKEAENRIFYTDLLEKMHFLPDRALVKFLVRKVLYPVLACVALIWQYLWGHEPLLF